jgi:hypothetical protein
MGTVVLLRLWFWEGLSNVPADIIEVVTLLEPSFYFGLRWN